MLKEVSSESNVDTCKIHIEPKKLIKVTKINIKGVSKDYNVALNLITQGFLREVMPSNKGISKDKS